MANSSQNIVLALPPVILALLIVLLLLWIKLGKSSAARKVQGSLFRNAGAPYRNLVGMLLGVIVSLFALISGTWSVWVASWVFAIAVALIIVLLVAVGPKGTGQFAWGLPVIVVLGFGLGGLTYLSRSWWIWLWHQVLRIDQPYKWALVALFAIGSILGVFLVRNWAKDQKGFLESLTGILGGTFVAAFFVKMFEGVPQMQQWAFSLYAVGFALSGALNLIFAGRLTAQYTNRRTLVSRAILDFMYGAERAEIIDKYFLKNFEADPDYAKRWLTSTLSEFCELVKREFATRMETRRQLRPQWHYYELISIKDEPGNETSDQGEHSRKGQTHKVLYRHLATRSLAGGEHEADSGEAIIRKEMFRVGVSIKNADHMEYIVAPGEYHAPFPLLKSVAGLALEMRQSVVMDRDRDRKFRNKDHKDGISPKEVEQVRGLDEIDYLSYILLPVVSRLGESTENPLGVVHIDTMLFVSKKPLHGEPEEADKDVRSISLEMEELHKMADNLYEENDEYIRYCERLTEIIRPVLELYARCRVGAT